jgi:hypothetical protein
LAQWFAQESRRVYAVLAEGDEQRDLRQRVEFIRAKGGTITARSLQRSNRRKYPTADAAALALEAVAQVGLGEWVDPPAAPRGGQPARQFRLQPTADTTRYLSGGDEDGDEDGDGPIPDPPDTTADTTLPAPQNPRVFGGSVGRLLDGLRIARDRAGGQETAGGSVGLQAVVSDMPDCRTSTQAPLPGLDGKPASAGRQSGVSDTGVNSNGPYRKDLRA